MEREQVTDSPPARKQASPLLVASLTQHGLTELTPLLVERGVQTLHSLHSLSTADRETLLQDAMKLWEKANFFSSARPSMFHKLFANTVDEPQDYARLTGNGSGCGHHPGPHPAGKLDGSNIQPLAAPLQLSAYKNDTWVMKELHPALNAAHQAGLIPEDKGGHQHVN